MCFVPLFSGPLVVSPLPTDLYNCCTSFAVLLQYMWVVGLPGGRHCCTTFCCTAVSRCVDRFAAVVLSCRVSTASWIMFFLLLFFSRYTGPALAQFSVRLVLIYVGTFHTFPDILVPTRMMRCIHIPGTCHTSIFYVSSNNSSRTCVVVLQCSSFLRLLAAVALWHKSRRSVH